MSRVLVTGATGFIGRQCVPMLVAKGHEVHAVARRRPAQPADGDTGWHANVRWHETDLLCTGSAARMIAEVKPEHVLHLAWYAIAGKFWGARENIDWVRATLELLLAFSENGGRRIVAAGTCAEYAGDAGECQESTTPLLPTSLYGMSKHALQTILSASIAQTGVSSAWGRNFFLYGPHEHPSRLVAYTVQNLLRGEPALCSEGLQTLDFMHVEDAASAYVALLESAVEGPVNIGSGNAVMVRDVLREIGHELGRPELIHLGARQPNPQSNSRSNLQPTRLWANTRRLREEACWTPRYDLRTGIAQTIDWWRGVKDLPAQVR